MTNINDPATNANWKQFFPLIQQINIWEMTKFKFAFWVWNIVSIKHFMKTLSCHHLCSFLVDQYDFWYYVCSVPVFQPIRVLNSQIWSTKVSAYWTILLEMINHTCGFLAPTGTQEVTMFICPPSPSLSIFWIHDFRMASWWCHDDVMMTSWWLYDDFWMTLGWLQDDLYSLLRALREQSDFVILS